MGLSVGVPARDVERIMLELSKAWLKLIEEYTAPWSMWKKTGSDNSSFLMRIYFYKFIYHFSN